MRSENPSIKLLYFVEKSYKVPIFLLLCSYFSYIFFGKMAGMYALLYARLSKDRLLGLVTSRSCEDDKSVTLYFRLLPVISYDKLCLLNSWWPLYNRGKNNKQILIRTAKKRLWPKRWSLNEGCIYSIIVTIHSRL